MHRSTHLDDIDMLDGPEYNDDGQTPPEDSETPDPPARLAARFYRSATNRRTKSAAVSSRRSSISSLHSHHSANRTCHSGVQSNHVAQHLRRASILEGRKARLADRAAHAEKVRLRAALAKTAPRSNFEEKALLAQQAREKYLAEITARCEEEVRRAKKIAEEMKEQKAAENAKLRQGLEEKFAEAERRRLLYQRTSKRRRNTSLPPVVEKKVVNSDLRPLSEPASARMIQRAWRNYQKKKILKEYLTLDLSVERIQRMTFDDVGELISSEHVLSTTTRLLKVLNLTTGESESQDQAAARVFLSIFLILGQGSHVFSHNGEQEQDLAIKARHLLAAFRDTVQKSCNIHDPSFTNQLEMLSESYTTFSTAFEAWKAHDSSALVQIMLDQFISLHNIWQTVKNDTEGGVAAEYRDGIRMNQTLLLTRMKRLAGSEEALKMVQQALRNIKRAKSRTKVRDVKPRAVSEGETSSPSVAKQILSPPDGKTTAKVNSHLKPLSKHQDASSDQQIAGNAAASIPLARPIVDDTRLTQMLTTIPDNRILVHELAINKEFKIEARRDVSKEVYDTFCVVLREDIAQGRGDMWTVIMARVIRDQLLRLVPEGKSMCTLISETLDPDVIEQQCRVGSFSYDKFFSFMSTILLQLCAPVHDPEIKAFAVDTSDVVTRLAKLLKIINTICLDYANFMLQLAAPKLIPEAPRYEQVFFADDLATGRTTLERTERWWKNSRAKLVEELSRRDPEGINPNPTPTSAQIYTQALCELVISNTPWDDENSPETLHLDLTRLHGIHTTVTRIVLIASILLTSKNLLKRDVRSQWKPEAERMWDALSSPPTSSVASDPSSLLLTIISSTHSLPPTTKTQLQYLISRLVSQVQTSQLTDPVAKVLFSRLRTHVITRLSASSASDRVRVASTASQVLANAGFAELGEKVAKVVDVLAKVREEDLKAHGTVYDEVERGVGAGSRAGNDSAVAAVNTN
ncbi:MAG: hypothetical protein M1834_002029 [Cirrosporium novae-zelandiae]|nr:MAG: hypothetical protein M1834_002029 [Cirrosporium novae-zelandiae]